MCPDQANAVEVGRQLTPYTGQLCDVCDHAVTNDHVPLFVMSPPDSAVLLHESCAAMIRNEREPSDKQR